MFSRTLQIRPGPPDTSPAVDGRSRRESPGLYGLRSFHPGGANVLFLDGSVRFLKDGVGLPAIGALGSTRQGEVLSVDVY